MDEEMLEAIEEKVQEAVSAAMEEKMADLADSIAEELDGRLQDIIEEAVNDSIIEFFSEGIEEFLSSHQLALKNGTVLQMKHNGEGCAGPLQDAAENVAAEIVRSQQMGGGGGFKLAAHGHGVGVVRRPEKAQQDQRRHKSRKDQAHPQVAVHGFASHLAPPSLRRGSIR